MLRTSLQFRCRICCGRPPKRPTSLPRALGRCDTAAPPLCAWQQQQRSQAARRRCSVAAASDDEKLGIVQTEELRDGSIMFRFGEEADSSSASAAAADAAKDAGISSEAADAAATAGAEVTAATDDSPATDGSPAPAQSTAAPAAADEIPKPEADSAEAVGAETSSSDDDPHTETEAAGSASQSVDKQQLQDMKVTELKELARENDLKGYSTLRKNELVDFLADALPGDYQI